MIGAALEQLGRLMNGGTLVGLSDCQLVARYAASNDGAAFEAIVARHGPMVLATCRAVLHEPSDVEDAFQATFLVLARRANSLRVGDALGGWLHRVAYRVAIRAASVSSRRRLHEREASVARVARQTTHEFDFQLRVEIHDEIERLPDRHRLPIVLCDLEGLTYEQAALEPVMHF